jgi:hypothetical protein
VSYSVSLYKSAVACGVWAAQCAVETGLLESTHAERGVQTRFIFGEIRESHPGRDPPPVPVVNYYMQVGLEVLSFDFLSFVLQLESRL